MENKQKRKFIVCDYPNPNNFKFPNFDLGSTERKFWLIAKTISEWNDFEMILVGPLWQRKYVPKAKYFKDRLSPENIKEFVKKFGKADYLFASTEYFNDSKIVGLFESASDKLISYITYPCNLRESVFDSKSRFLFCYSDEMMNLYRSQSPIKSLLFNIGVNEKIQFTDNPDGYLVWLGRIDEDKSPHYAMMAAEKMKMNLYILGKSLRQPGYEKKIKKILNSKYVKNLGLVVGQRKMDILSRASCGVYTCGRNFREAGASTLAEMLCSGIPIAGISWAGNDAVCEAVNDPGFGSVAVLDKGDSEEIIVDKLIGEIKKCLLLDRKYIAKTNLKRFDMDKLLRNIINEVDLRYVKRS